MGISSVINKIVFSSIEPENSHVLWMVKEGNSYNFRYFQDGIWEPILVTKEDLEALIENSLEIKSEIEAAALYVQTTLETIALELVTSNQNKVTVEGYMNTTQGLKNDTSALKTDVINLKQDTLNLKDAAANIVSGGPKGTYDTLEDLNLANPDQNWTYVTIDNGHWNYYNPAVHQFVSGGIYLSPLNIVQEFGYSDTDVISQLAITDKIDAIDISISEIGVELATKFDGAYAENGLLYLTANDVVIGQGIEVGSGTGGGGGGSTATTVVIRVTPTYSGIFAVAKDAPTLLHITFSSVYTEDQAPTGNGTATIYVNSKQVAVRTIAQGDTIFDVEQYVGLGTNLVNVSIVDALGSSRIVQFSITVVSIEMSSSFDNLIPYNAAIPFKYIPTGTQEKTIKFFVDGVSIGLVVTSYSGRQLTYLIPVQTHGSHILEAYAEAEVNGVIVISNVLHYDIMFNIEGNATPIIGSSYVPIEMILFDTISIPYIVYSPLTLDSTITLEINGDIVSTIVVDRTLHTWNYKTTSGGVKEMTIRCGDVSKTFNVTVSGSLVTSEAETQDLELYLTAVGRSNNEVGTLNEWKFGNIEAQLTGFNHSTDGWIADNNGDAALRISGDARVFIPLNIFSTDFRTYGKTIEFEFATSNINDFYTVPIKCWSGMTGLERGFLIKVLEAFFRSDLTSISTKFKEGERVRVSYVIEEKTANRLVSIYINGILSGVILYPLNDNFIQLTPVGITIGTNGCTTDIYNIRVYNNNLNEFLLLDNYIADMDNVDLKLDLFLRNQLFDTYGEIVYSKVLESIPCMTLIGDLPQYKGNKKNVVVVYEDIQTPTNSFTTELKAGKTNIDVQGTSSQYYPRKNYKIDFSKSILKNSLGEIVTGSKYQLRPTSIPVPIFTVKADFAESSGTHNTGVAQLAENLLVGMNYKTPPQLVNPLVRTTVEGFPIIIFHKATADSPRTFLGKYNFNCDKGSTDAFGFTLPAVQLSWEFLNNTSERCLFLSDDLTSLQPDGVTPAWKLDFDIRYPDTFPSTIHLLTLLTWMVSCNPDTATDVVLPVPVALPYPDPLHLTTYTTDSANYRRGKFKNEFNLHFNRDNILSYYLITELFGMTDQRAKNQFLTSWGNEGSGEYKWYFILYDNDTCLGINNEGALVFNYNIEYHDSQVWNGEASLLWNLVEECFGTELLTMYQTMRSSNAISYSKTLDILNTQLAFKWAESIYNLDGKYKYIDPMTIGYYDSSVNQFVKTSAFLYALQGSRTEHRKWYLYNRFRYIDSKYTAGDYQNDFATMRLYYPEGELAVPVNHDFTLTPYADQYTRVKFGSYLLGDRSYADTDIVIAAPVGSHFNDTETIIYGASRLNKIGDLSSKYPGTVDMSKATNLTEIIIGNATAGYRNPNLKSLSLGNNDLLKKLDILNCSFDALHPQALDLSNCLNIEEVYANGVENLTTFVFANGGNLKTLQAPNCLNNITLLNQPFLNNFTLEGVGSITSIRIENCPLVDIQTLIETCMALDPVVLFRVRLLGVDWTFEDETFLYLLRTLHGFDEYDNITPVAVLSGTVTITGAISLTVYDNLVKDFPECTFIVPNLIDYSIEIVGNNYINGEGVYQIEFSDVDYGLYETERKAIALLEISLNGEAVTLVEGENNLYATISINDGILANPEGGITLRAIPAYVGTANEIDKTATKNVSLTGFLDTLTILGPSEVAEGASSIYTIEYLPSDTFQIDVTWEITSGGLYATIDVNTGELTIIEGSISDNVYPIIVKATSVYNPLKTATKNVTAANYSYRTLNITLLNDLLQLNPYILIDGEGTKRYFENGTLVFRANESITGVYGAETSEDIPFTLPATTVDTINDYYLPVVPLRTINVSYNTGGAALNARLTVGTDTYDATNGVILIRKSGAVSGTITDVNAEDEAFNSGVITEDTIINVTVTKLPLATIHMSALDSSPLVDPYIVISGTTYYPNGNGDVLIYSKNILAGIGYATGKANVNFSFAARTLDTTYQVQFDSPFTFADAEVLRIANIKGWNTYSAVAAVTSAQLGTTFKDNTVMTSFPELQYFTGLTNIPTEAFSNCINLTGALNIPANVTTINFSAFYNCKFTGTLVIPSSVTAIGNDAFNSCTGFTGNLVIPNTVTSLYSGGFQFLGCTGMTGTLTIGTGMTSIPTNCFSNCRFTCNLVIPNNITTIGSGAFGYNPNYFGNLIIPNTITSLDSGGWQFYGLTGMTGTLTIGTGITSIPKYCFEKCKFTGTLTIPASVTLIAQRAFDGCTGFTGNLVIPNTVISLTSDQIFSGCTGMTGTLTLGTGITIIPELCFSGCKFTGTLTIPINVTTISSNAFLGITTFTSVIDEATTPQTLSTGVFSGTYLIYVPNASVTAYKAATNWIAYAARIFGY